MSGPLTLFLTMDFEAINKSRWTPCLEGSDMADIWGIPCPCMDLPISLSLSHSLSCVMSVHECVSMCVCM